MALAMACMLVAWGPSLRIANGADAEVTDAERAERGYRYLLDHALIPPDFDQETIEEVWQVWPAALKKRAATASQEERRQMIFERYGLTPRPDDPTKPLQYVVDASGRWTMNCFACHGGLVDGKTYPGSPNHEFDLQTLTEETRKNKIRLGKPFARMDVGSVVVPLGSSRGTTNAVMFGVALMHFRDKDLRVVDRLDAPPMRHHDMDAPPWWNYSARDHIYIDGFAAKSHRSLMQFALVRENGPGWFHQHEAAFRDVQAYLTSVEPPRYPHAIDRELAEQGRGLFQSNCAKCHGSHDGSPWPGVAVPIDMIGTDRVRWESLAGKGREVYAESWFAEHDQGQTVVDPEGYVAPPLRGIWASAPYLHNGSVPTLWQFLNPESRPQVWRKVSAATDFEKVGLTVEVVSGVPEDETDPSQRRRYFDARRPGKSAAGHDYPGKLSESERRALLEFLKTL